PVCVPLIGDGQFQPFGWGRKAEQTYSRFSGDLQALASGSSPEFVAVSGDDSGVVTATGEVVKSQSATAEPVDQPSQPYSGNQEVFEHAPSPQQQPQPASAPPRQDGYQFTMPGKQGEPVSSLLFPPFSLGGWIFTQWLRR